MNLTKKMLIVLLCSAVVGLSSCNRKSGGKQGCPVWGKVNSEQPAKKNA